MNYIQPFNTARAKDESFENYKKRRSVQNQLCKASTRMAGVAWESQTKGTKWGKFK